MVSYPAKSENIIMHSIDAADGNDAWWQLQEGTVRVDNHSWLRATQYAGRFVALGLVGAIFWQLRGLLSRIGQSDVFNDANVKALRKIGTYLVIGSVISILLTVVTQYAIMEAMPAVIDSNREIHPSLSWSTPGKENIWMDYTPPLVPLLLAMIAFITAGAFKSGQQFREDSESVV